MERYMITKIVFPFILISIFVMYCDRTPQSGRQDVTSFHIEEELDSIPLVTVSEDIVGIYDIRSFEQIGSYPLHLDGFLEAVFYDNTLFIICRKDIFRLDAEKNEFKKTDISFEIDDILRVKNGLYLFGNNTLFKLKKNGSMERVTGFKQKPDNIYALPDLSAIFLLIEENETMNIYKFSLLSGKTEHKIEVRDYVSMDVSPFGKRIYILTEDKLMLLSPYSLEVISVIPLGGEASDFIVTASENKIFIFMDNPAKIVAIKRALLKVISETTLKSLPGKIHITGDGGTIFLMSTDSLYRFDTGGNDVVKKAAFPKGADILLSTEKGSRIIIGKRREHTLEIIDGNSLDKLKEIKIEHEILGISCGRIPFGKSHREPFAMDSLNKDSVERDTTVLTPVKAGEKYYTLQVSSSSIREGAYELYRKIAGLRLPVYIDSSTIEKGQKIYKVRIGAFDSRKDVENFRKGIKSTYDLTSWVAEDIMKPTLLTKAGVDINGDDNCEILLFGENRILLFTNVGGVLGQVFYEDINGLTYVGKPVILKAQGKRMIGFPFCKDSLLMVKWMGDHYQTVRIAGESEGEK
jgi:hypothetical protein